MRLPASLLLALSTSAAAQVADKLPRGLSGVEGSSYHWAGWSANDNYVPARCTYSYDRSVFPWPGIFEIHRLWLRRDSVVRSTFTAHQKRLKIKMSTNGFAPNRPRCMFEKNLGRDQVYVLGNKSDYRTVNFPAASFTGSPAPFEVAIQLDRPFVVPPGAENLQVDFMIQRNSTSVGTWYCDAEFQQGALDGGFAERIAGKCPQTSKAPVSNLLWPGSDVFVYCDTMEPFVPVVGWLGKRLAKPMNIGGACMFHVAGATALVAMSSRDAKGTVRFEYGLIPNHNHFVGNKLCFQATILRSGYPINGTYGITDALEMTVGSGYPSNVSVSTVYSYGEELTPEDPDTTFPAAYISSRAVVLGIN